MVQHPPSTHLQIHDLLLKLPGYDKRFIAMAIKHFRVVDIKVIRQQMEKYLTLSIGKHLVFRHSLQFQGSSLATLARHQDKTGLESFLQLSKTFHGFYAHDMRLLLRKKGYPYPEMDSWEKMDEKLQLPHNEAFYSKRSDSHFSAEDNQHALTVFESYKCDTMRTYHNLYVICMFSLLSFHFNLNHCIFCINFSCFDLVIFFIVDFMSR